MKFDQLVSTGKSMFDQAANLRGLSKDVRGQLEFEQFKATSRLVPSMLLGNIFLASVNYVTVANGSYLAVKTVLYVILCAVCILGMATWRQMTRIEMPEGRRVRDISRRQLPFVIVSLALGLIWAVIPPMLAFIHSPQQLIMVSATIAGIFCVGGFALVPMPMMAVAFLSPIVLSSFAALLATGTSQAILMAFSLILYVLFIIGAAVSQTKSMVRVVMAGHEVAQQQKTISLLLRDFEKHSSDWLWETAAAGQFLRPSERFSEVSTLSKPQLVARTLKDLFFSGESAQHPSVEVLIGSMDRQVSFNDLQVPVKLNGETHWWSMTGTPNFDESGAFTGYHGVGSDITLQKKSDERISFLAHNDALTGLLNRAHFTEVLHQNVTRLERYGAQFALMFLDLDHFKAVNDTFGHPMGDKLLVEVASRLRAIVPAGSFAARLGGDEFAILIPKSVTVDDIEALAGQVLKSIVEPFEFDGEKMSVGVSIGMAIAPRHGTRPDQLLRNVDLALYRAKESGRNAYKVFESGMDSQARERRALEFDLKFALENKELELFYQPLMGTEENKPVGFEALLRWNHPIRGRISPAEFVPIAENTGLIKSIGEWVIREACRTAASWPSELTIAVNLSAPQFDKDRIVDVVTSALAETGLAPHRLELEITESLLIERPDEVLATLMRLKEIGVSIAMDDFGTGYSSLSYLLKFPFDKIKIDKSFISAIDEDKAACDVLRTIGSLGKTLGIRITAEGVETQEQVNFLRAIACDQLQGFFFAKPLQAADVPGFLLSRTAISLESRVGNLRSDTAKAA
jgi:diguanylate cyclase (GGDEF)-like protein/PAS domain S-box-containing protein